MVIKLSGQWIKSLIWPKFAILNIVQTIQIQLQQTPTILFLSDSRKIWAEYNSHDHSLLYNVRNLRWKNQMSGNDGNIREQKPPGEAIRDMAVAFQRFWPYKTFNCTISHWSLKVPQISHKIERVLQENVWSGEKASIPWYMVRSCDTSFDGSSDMTECHFHCIKSLTGLSLSAAQLQTEVTKHDHEVIKNPFPLSGWFYGWNSTPCSEFTHTEKESILSTTSV